MRWFGPFNETLRPKNHNVITPKWVFWGEFENGILVKHKARLVAQGFTHVSGLGYHGPYLYAPVVQLETFRALISIAALFDLGSGSIILSALSRLSIVSFPSCL